MIRREWFLEPARLVSLAFGFQFFLWLVLFPEQPSVATGEPKYTGFSEIFVIFMFLLMFIYFAIAGKFLNRQKAPPQECVVREREAKFLHGVGIICFWIYVVVFTVNFMPLFRTPHLMLRALEPSGLNYIRIAIQDDRALGLGTLSHISLVAQSIALCSCSSKDLGFINKRSLAIRLAALFGMAVFASIFETVRLAIVNLVLLAFFSFMLSHKHFHLRALVFCGLCLALFIWLGSLSRTGILLSETSGEPLMSAYVQGGIYAELNEKYLPGEFNNTLILLSYPADTRNNWLYGTMFQRYGSGYRPAFRYLNTMHSFGIWYWQFGLWGLLLAAILGFLSGYTYSALSSSKGALSFSSITYSFFFIALIQFSRVNFFLLQYFLVPIAIMSLARLIFSLSSLAAHNRSSVSAWRSLKRDLCA
ncbi:MAG: O-antigen polymerase [Anaerolineae bacterium]